jgi:hypothetical protein
VFVVCCARRRHRHVVHAHGPLAIMVGYEF